jgi:hypothetical protein
MNWRRHLVVGLAMFSLLAPVRSFAVEPPLSETRSQSRPMRWRGSTVNLAVSSSFYRPNSAIKADSDAIGALDRAIETWRLATGLEFRVELSDKQNVSAAGVSGDGQSLITIAQTPENLQLFAKDPFAEAARTRVFHNRKFAITEADIVLNPLEQFSTDGTYGTFDLETILTHEIGHVIGLRHTDVIGSLMSERLPRNAGETFGPRSLTSSDLAAARELYSTEADDCCGTISGRISLPSGRSAKGTGIWVEDEDGRVSGHAMVAGDGSYRIGGLTEGTYRVYWRRNDANDVGAGTVGRAEVEALQVVTLSQRIQPERTGFSMDRIGTNFQPSDAALRVRAGRQYVICVAGSNLRDLTNLTFNSPFLHADRASLLKQDFGEKVDAFTITISVDADTPEGAYSLFAERSDGLRSVMVGGLVVSK